MTFLNLALLPVLAAVSIPVVIHLLNRRRYDVVDWAAMQFLHESQRRRRRILLDDWLLLALRVALVAVLVLAVAGPLTRWNPWGRSGTVASRDVILVIDGSGSMAYRGAGPLAEQNARRWAADFIRGLGAGDRVAILVARERPTFALPLLSGDMRQAESVLDGLPRPRGGADWAAAVQQALRLLGPPGDRSREVIVLTDGQRHGWADAAAVERWELLAGGTDPSTLPRIWVANVAADRPADAPAGSLGPISASRTVAPVGREVRFQTELAWRGRWPQTPTARVRLEVDGRPAGELKAPAPGDQSSVTPLTFSHRFTSPGSHLVSATLDPAALPGDGRQDYALDVVPTVPVVIVDGGPDPMGRGRPADFLRDALAPALDPEPAFRVRQVSVDAFNERTLAPRPGRGNDDVPRVLVLQDVPALNAAQDQAVQDFLATGGGVLVALGPHCDPRAYNDALYRDGNGWLPARLDRVVGDEADLDRAARLVPAGLDHPALELFKDALAGGLMSAYFPRHWKLGTPGGARGVSVAVLTDRLPLFAEKAFANGRVIASTVPLDNAWRTNLTDLGDFVRLSHELMYYLAGSDAGGGNVRPRQPIVLRPDRDATPASVTVEAPGAAPRTERVSAWPLVFNDTADPGVYKLTPEGGRPHYFVVRSDPGEADLTPCDDVDREKIRALLPSMRYIARPGEAVPETDGESRPQDWGWLLLIALLGLLGAELFLARRLLTGKP